MNCVIVVETDCCTHNCSKAEEDKKNSLEEYEAGSSDDEDEEEIDKLSTKTFPIDHRP